MTRLMNKLLCFLYCHKLIVVVGFFLIVLFCIDCAWAATTDCSDLSDEEKYLCYCKSDTIDKKYVEAGCWSCDVIYTLMMSMTKVANAVFDKTIALSKIILGGGACIWIALYFLKTLGSFTTQDPSKVIDGLLTFCFKVAFIYALLDSGIASIVGYVVNPLLSIGLDIGTVFSKATGF